MEVAAAEAAEVAAVAETMKTTMRTTSFKFERGDRE
jgi:hypothetical protein